MIFYFNKELVLKLLEKAMAFGKPSHLAFLYTNPCNTEESDIQDEPIDGEVLAGNEIVDSGYYVLGSAIGYRV